MSYCRFSSDNWKSDVYVYCSDSGYEIHVAGRRRMAEAPEVPNILTADPAVWMAAHKVQMDWLDKTELVAITLPYAGESFCEPTAEDCLDRLKMLRGLGYYVPQYAIERLDEEIADEVEA